MIRSRKLSRYQIQRIARIYRLCLQETVIYQVCFRLDLPDVKMDKKLILLIVSELLLQEGIENLIKTKAGMDVTSINPLTEIQLIAGIDRIQPDIVIMDTFYQNLDEGRVWMNILGNHKNFRLIIINHDTNWIQVYIKQEVRIDQSTDLFMICQNDLFVVNERR